MSNTTIDPNLLLSTSIASRTGGKTSLGKDDFLKILMTQLQNQDPSNPMEDKEFISQMASFSTLEQMTNMTSVLEKFLETQNQGSILQYSEMIGKQIEWDDLAGQSGVAIVQSVKKSGTDVKLLLADGKEILASYVNQISKPEAEK
jgi:flagellar basal-body rod modification protein FlgD